MSLPKIKVHSFTLDFFYRGKREPTPRDKPTIAEQDCIHIINDIPPYLRGHRAYHPPFKFFRIKKYTGFLADLESHDSIDAYLLAQFSRNGRSQLKRSIKRLEKCFDISYRWYHGPMEATEYERLFEKFRELIERRFQQRGDRHLALQDWEDIKGNAHRQICRKEASLFVIFDRDKPIDICLNYHYKEVMNNLIRSYDIDYGKFSLGYIDLYKQIEWCFNNHLKKFDLSRGDMFYKRQWCNLEYPFSCEIYYNQTSVIAFFMALSLAFIFVIKEFLKKIKVDHLVKKIRKFFRRKPSTDTNMPYTEVAIKSELPLSSIAGLHALDPESPEFLHLRKAIYEFQYLYSESFMNIGLYREGESDGAFIVCGKKSCARIEIYESWNLKDIE